MINRNYKDTDVVLITVEETIKSVSPHQIEVWLNRRLNNIPKEYVQSHTLPICRFGEDCPAYVDASIVYYKLERVCVDMIVYGFKTSKRKWRRIEERLQQDKEEYETYLKLKKKFGE